MLNEAVENGVFAGGPVATTLAAGAVVFMLCPVCCKRVLMFALNACVCAVVVCGVCGACCVCVWACCCVSCM